MKGLSLRWLLNELNLINRVTEEEERKDEMQILINEFIWENDETYDKSHFFEQYRTGKKLNLLDMFRLRTCTKVLSCQDYDVLHRPDSFSGLYKLDMEGGVNISMLIDKINEKEWVVTQSLIRGCSASTDAFADNDFGMKHVGGPRQYIWLNYLHHKGQLFDNSVVITPSEAENILMEYRGFGVYGWYHELKTRSTTRSHQKWYGIREEEPKHLMPKLILSVNFSTGEIKRHI